MKIENKRNEPTCQLHCFSKVSLFDLQIRIFWMREQEALVKMDVRVTKTWRQESCSRFLVKLNWLVLFKRSYDPVLGAAYIPFPDLASHANTLEGETRRNTICFLNRHLQGN